METIYELIKSHAKGKGEETMWKSTAIISDAIEKSMPQAAKEKLYDDLFGLVSDGHYNERMARADIEKMYYIDESGEEQRAPYFNHATIMEAYEKVASMIPAYNEWDFAVTMNMVASDNHNLIVKWFPDATPEERLEKYVELAVNWLYDVDWPTTDRIWAYIH